MCRAAIQIRSSFIAGIWAVSLLETKSVAAFSTTPSVVASSPRGIPDAISRSSLSSSIAAEGGIASMEELDDESMIRLLFRPPEDKSAVLVDAYAPWCGPCKLIEPILERCSERHAGELNVIRYDVEGSNTSKVKVEMLLQGVMLKGLPALALYLDGEPLALHSGMITEDDLEAWLDGHLFSKPELKSATAKDAPPTNEAEKGAAADAEDALVTGKRGLVSFAAQMKDDYML